MRQKTRIFIYILIAIAVVIMGTHAILGNHNADTAVSAQEHIDLGRIYLVELSYEKAVLEFTEAIEIEPLNADAYLGLAETYAGMGDIEKAIDVLEEGYEKTGDERLKDMLEELQPHEETTVTTVIAAEEVTTASTVEMAIVPDLSGLSEEQAIAACEAAGLKYSISYDYSDDVEKGYVVSQVIPMNTSVVEGVSVPFTVSDGVEVVTTIATATEDFIIIRGEKYSISVTELTLNFNELTDEDIKDLDKLTALETLSLSKNHHDVKSQISDISILSGLTNLEMLILCNSKISNINVLNELTNLTGLYLIDNQISDINALGELKNLINLDLSANRISDISALSGLTNLTHLGLLDNQISDVNKLSGLINLKSLWLSNNRINNIKGLGELKNLISLQISNNQISDISELKELVNLNSLDLKNNQVSDINALKKLINLKHLNLENNPISKKDIKELQKALPNCEIIY